MNTKKLGKRTMKFETQPIVKGFGAVVGKKEGEGPLGTCFDMVCDDGKFGQETWEKAESEMQKQAMDFAVKKSALDMKELDYILGGDLLNQCIGTAFAVRESNIPFFGLYGACSTMAESIILGSTLIDGGFADYVGATASSHFCSAERQYRFPLAYGGQRTPTAQWTATACGAVVLAKGKTWDGIKVTHACVGRVVDLGVTDASNMGAAMAPSAYDTFTALWEDTNTTPDDYSLMVTGDLGEVGSNIFAELCEKDGINVSKSYSDCGLMLFDKSQDAHAGASGCGCSASVLCGSIFKEMLDGRYKKVIFAGTGALMSPMSVQQSESIPGICHAVIFER